MDAIRPTRFCSSSRPSAPASQIVASPKPLEILQVVLSLCPVHGVGWVWNENSSLQTAYGFGRRASQSAWIRRVPDIGVVQDGDGRRHASRFSRVTPVVYIAASPSDGRDFVILIRTLYASHTL